MQEPSVLGYIKEQPERLKYVFDHKDIFINPFVDTFTKNKIKKIIFFGSGTSYNVSILGTYYFKHLVGIDAEYQYPTVFKYYEKADWSGLLKKDEILFVGISQSGTSISTCEVMKFAREKGYHTLAITGNLESEITKYVDTKVHLLVGDELTPPETKGYTTSVLSVYLWAVTCAHEMGKMNEDTYKKALMDTRQLIDQFQTVIDESEAWYEQNKTTIVNSDRLYFLGYGIDYATAIEAQLKVGEMLRLPALGYEIEEYSHGPTMAISKKQTICIIGSDEAEFKHSIDFSQAFKKYTDRVHFITYKEMEKDSRNCVFSVKTNKYLAPLMFTVPFQFIAAKGAKDIGINTAINPFDENLAHYED